MKISTLALLGANQNHVDPVTRQHEARDPAHLVDAHGYGLVSWGHQCGKSTSLARTSDFAVQDRFVAIDCRKRDAPAIFEETPFADKGPLGHVLRGPRDLCRVFRRELGTKFHFYFRDQDGAVRSRHGTRLHPIMREESSHAA